MRRAAPARGLTVIVRTRTARVLTGVPLPAAHLVRPDLPVRSSAMTGVTSAPGEISADVKMTAAALRGAAVRRSVMALRKKDPAAGRPIQRT